MQIMKRTLIVGDIHGCLDELKELVSIFSPRDGDVVISVGDVIGKGYDPAGCIDYLESINAVVVLGNHEYWYLKYFPFDEDSIQRACLDNTKKFKKHILLFKSYNLEKYYDWMKNLPLFYESDDFIVLHGGFDPRISLEENTADTITSIRKLLSDNGEKVPWFDLYKGEKHIFFGHWAKMGFYHSKKVTCLDTGCVYGKKLTGYIVEEDRVIEVRAKDVYCEIRER